MSGNSTISTEELSFNNTQIAFGHKPDADLRFSILMFRLVQSSSMVKYGTYMAQIALKLRLPISPIVKATVFRQFCGGETINECNSAIVDLGKANIGAILDYSVEGADDEATFEATTQELLRNSDKAKDSPQIPVTCLKMTGIARFGLLEKVSAQEDLSPAEKQEYAKVVYRFKAICDRALTNNVPVYVDAEESWIQPAIDRLVESMMRQYNTKRAIVFTTLQMYRHDKIDHLDKLLAEGEREGFIPGVKFVRGAYLEKENNRAKVLGYPTPMQPDKESTDRDFDKAIRTCVEHINHIEICAGTHNEASSMKLAQLMEAHGLPANHPHIYFSQLFGMSDHISYNLANAGFNVSKYLPYGPVKATMPYLIRRAEENTAISGQMGKELGLLLMEKQRRKEQTNP